MDGVADPRKGPGEVAPPPPLLYLDQTKILFGDQAPPRGSGSPGPPLAQGLDPTLGCPVSKL